MPSTPAAAQHVLVVDDDDGVRSTMAALLEDCGYRVSEARDGASMRDAIDTGDFIDVVVMDVNMPGETSESLALYVRDLGLPLVMISGSRRAVQFARAKSLQLLVKPFTQDQLDQAVRLAIEDPEAGRRVDKAS